ncbi:MAG: ImmA/IrrE family metallo-endopeptidase [Methylovirgula sp.]
MLFLDGDGEERPVPQPTSAELEQRYLQSLSLFRSIEQRVLLRNKNRAASDPLEGRGGFSPQSAESGTIEITWQSTFGSRLKAARESKNLTQDALAAEICPEASAKWILDVEEDAFLPDIEAIAALARRLETSAGYLVNADELRLVDRSPRNVHKLTPEQLRQVEVRAIDFAHRYLDLEEQLDETVPELTNISMPTASDAEEAAQRIRSVWNLGEVPIVSLTSVFEEKGIKIFPVDLPKNKGDGLALRIDEDGRPKAQIIAYAKDSPIDRTRFTLAHELAHLLDPNVSEDMANYFAGAFLLPAEVLRSRLAGIERIGIEHIIPLKEEYGISAQAITYRCRDIGLGDGEGLASLRRSLDKEKDNYPIADLGAFSERPRRFEELRARVHQAAGRG